MRAIARLIGAVVLVWSGMAAASAADDAAATAWQATVTGQVDAMRRHDAGTAFSYAGALFKTTFPNPESFLMAIEAWGYGPIISSRSHSFGSYERPDETTVLQQVQFVGKDQQLYTAIYQLMEEPSGWRVMGVQLVPQNAIGV